MYRQGDVLLVPIERPEGVEPEAAGEIVLALGEVTGHRHRFAGRSRSGARAYRKGPDRFVEVLRGARLVHEEHSTIDVAPGFYEVVIQSEYDEGLVRQVVD